MATSDILQFTPRCLDELARQQTQREGKTGKPVLLGLLQILTADTSATIFALGFYDQEARSELAPFLHPAGQGDVAVMIGPNLRATPSGGTIDYADGRFSLIPTSGNAHNAWAVV